MKITTIILSLYLILLSCLPCADTKVKDVHVGSNLVVTVENSHSHTNEKHSDLCPPFCSCNCCAVQVLTFNPTLSYSFSKETELIILQISTYHSVLKSNFFGSIWQPPQIV